MRSEPLDFTDAAALIIESEGGERITDDPRDPGGLTKYGISQRAYPRLDIERLTRDEVIALPVP